MKSAPLQKKISSQGFSLIEVLVSLALFAVVMTMAVGTLVVLIDANSKAQTIETLVNSISSTVDAMTRELRTGYNISCYTSPTSLDLSNDQAAPANCSQGRALAFTETGSGLTNTQSNSRIGYYLNTSDQRIYRVMADGVSIPVTPESVTINEFDVSVFNSLALSASGGDERSPTVTIYIAGEAGDIPLLDTSFSLQTTVTQQLLDL